MPISVEAAVALNLMGGLFVKCRRVFAALILGAGFLAACQGGDPERGARLFQERGCHDCHATRSVPYHGPESNPSRGPDLAGVREKYRRGRLLNWLNDPEAVYREEGRRPVNPGYPPMPQVRLTGQEIEDLLAFLAEQ